MAKAGGAPNATTGRSRRAWNTLTSRNARYVYIVTCGIAAAVLLGEFVEAASWIRVVLGVMVSIFFLQVTKFYYLSNQIDDIRPQSAPTRTIIEQQATLFKDFTREALDSIEERLRRTIRTMPGLLALATDEMYQKHLEAIGAVAARARSLQADSVMRRILAISLEDMASDVESVAASKLVIKNQPEVADRRWKAVLEPDGGDHQYAVATSWVLPEWWELNKAWRVENATAAKQGLRLARVFIAENQDEMAANAKVMREQARQGIQVNWVYLDCLRENGLDPRDILISGCVIPDFENPDNSQKELLGGFIFGEQVLELGESGGTRRLGYRLVPKSVELSVYPPEVAAAREAIERIYRLSTRFDDPEWWSYFFEDDYIPITRYKDSTARHETEVLIKATNLKAGMRVLDLGCAHGRMEQMLEAMVGQLEVVPVECSQSLLSEAVSRATKVLPDGGVPALDMRDIDEHYGEEFDVVMSTFTTWGYFRECDNQAMYQKVFAVLKPGGLFYLDIDNPSFIRANTSPRQYESGGHIIRRCDAVKQSQEQDSSGQMVSVARRLSQFTVTRPDGSVISKPLVSLRLYDLNELRQIASAVGFKYVQALDEDGKPWTGSSESGHPTAQRIVVVLRKTAPKSKGTAVPPKNAPRR